MRIRPIRGGSRAAVAGLVAVACALGTAGLATAAPAPLPPPSACTPANQTGTITPSDSSAGHRHYSVTLRAAAGTVPCTLQGSPTGVVFRQDGTPLPYRATPYGQGTAVRFGPGHPVSFDVQVRNVPGGAAANGVTFHLRDPQGAVLGESAARGPLRVNSDVQVGPVHAG